ncbi:tetratricopeptide repeat protein [Lacrimispora sp. NSJ-141]|uniref:Tetratricopeptide repeat protein n=1 Tax=Lientehia hominis TaxID=2897778 RepID=A0AAP2W7L5_9FIRM|nr:tetratricopeptide repeat protein [Lientehia hominis]MCD2491185.1 tetratricopeptide repeat protein [Lientehia hominis]
MKKDSQKKLAVLLGVLCLSLILILSACMMVFEKHESRASGRWREAIELGDIYQEEGSYEEAAISYREAISLEPGRDEEPYVKLVDIYLLEGDYESAQSVIEEGMGCLGTYPELERQSRVAEAGLSGESQTVIKSETMEESETMWTESGDSSGSNLDFAEGYCLAAQGGLTAAVAEGTGVNIYSQGQVLWELSIPGIYCQIAFNGDELIYAKKTEEDAYAIYRNEINGSGEQIIGICEDIPEPVGRIGADYYFLSGPGEGETSNLYRVNMEDSQPVLVMERIGRAQCCGSYMYCMEQADGMDAEAVLYQIDGDGNIMEISADCRYMEMRDGALYFAEAEGTGQSYEWSALIFYRYDPAKELYTVLGESKSEDGFVISMTSDSAVYCTGAERGNRYSWVYYEVDFLQGTESFLTEEISWMDAFADDTEIYLFDYNDRILYQVMDNGILESRQSISEDASIKSIYDGWIYAESDDGQNIVIYGYGPV